MCWMKIGREIIFQSWLLCDCFYTEMSPTLPLCIGEFFIIGHNPFRVTWAVLPWSIALLSWLSVGSNIIHIRVRFFSGGLSAGIRIQLCQESVFDRLNGIFTIEPFEPKVQVKIQIELEHSVWGSKGLSPRRNKRLQSNISRISQDGAQPQWKAVCNLLPISSG